MNDKESKQSGNMFTLYVYETIFNIGLTRLSRIEFRIDSYTELKNLAGISKKD